MTTKELEYFLAACQYGSIKTAAKKLSITSQGLSKVIIRLEDELHTQLFFRTTKGLTPTKAAQNLAVRVNIILTEMHNIQSDFALTRSGDYRVLTVATTYGVLQYLTFQFIEEFYQAYPHIRLNLAEFPEAQIQEQLDNGKIELAFLPAPIDYSRLSGTFLTSWKHCLIINENHPLAQKESIAYTDLENVPLALKGRTYSVFSNNITRLLKQGVTPDIYLETTSEYLIHAAAEQNCAVGVTLDFLAEESVKYPTVIRYFKDPECVKDVYLVHRNTVSLSAEAQCFMDFTLNWIQHKSGISARHINLQVD